MDKKILIGNMKTKCDYQEVQEYIEKMKDHIDYPGLILMPTSLYVPLFQTLDVKIGLQNIYCENEGSYTGEVLPSQARSMGIRYALVGHSERRKFLHENNQLINKKMKAGIEANMGLVLCVGEDTEEKLMLETEEVLKRQIFTALRGIDDLKNIVIAYEPVWAIGTGEIPTIRELRQNVTFIKNFVRDLKEGSSIKVLYGGSINAENIKELIQIEELDGFLVGGASNNPYEFMDIIDTLESLS